MQLMRFVRFFVLGESSSGLNIATITLSK